MPNPIVVENGQTGNPDTQWDLSGIGQNSGPGVKNFIEGYATDISVNSGQTINFKINTDSKNYRGDIYRLGYYGGLGARQVATFQKSVASLQPAPLTDPVLGLVDAGTWTVTASWAVPSAAVSGVYIVHLVRQDGISGENHIPFVVRNDGVQRDIVFQTSDTTWHAYNGWGGYNLYGGGAQWDSEGRAAKVSYNRPIATRDSVGTYAGPQDFLFGVEYSAIRWLEANGYDVCYIAGVDTDRNGSLLLNHKVFLSVGHDEYWGSTQRANVEAARSKGVHLGFWSGNEVYWKCRWESSKAVTDGSPTDHRTLVCYKETRENAEVDPLDPTFWGGTWRDPRFSPPDDGGRPENALTGTMFQVDGWRYDSIQIPYPMTLLRFWRNSPLAATQPGQFASTPQNTLGYEWDQSPDNGWRPAGLICLSSTTLSVNTYLLDYGSTTGPGVATHNLTLYKDQNSGAIVFGAGTVMWAWGLDSDHDLTATPTDPNIRQAMVNLLGDMGCLAQTLQSGLVTWTASTDTTPPTSTITFPTSGTSVAQNQPITITGTASDSGGGRVGIVEVSIDGGSTWHPANGTTSWSYPWTPATAGPYMLKSRACDDSLNLETPGAGVSGTVTGSSTVSLFSGSSTPSLATENDPNPVELGVQFRSSQPGQVTGIRFYKGPSNTGTHVGHLWTGTGTLLATVTFSNETTNGWQQMLLPSPVAILANTIYVVSYHCSGFYSADGNYFNNAVTNGPLTAPASGSISPGNPGNGVYAYGAGSFPNLTFDASNYWVDVLFQPNSSQTWSISGTISPASLGAGTTVGLSGAATTSVTADSSGNYSFSGLANGAYTVTPSRSGDTFSPTSQSVTINSANATAVNFTAQGAPPVGIAIDATISLDQSSAPITTPAFSTTSANQLLLAFVATDYLSGANTTVTGVSGGGLTWALVRRTNVQSGTSEIWRAFAPAPLSNVTVSVTLSQNVTVSLTVMSFKGVDATGTNGSGAIGATGGSNSSQGAPTASLVTTRAGSWVLGVGNDYDDAIERTPGAGQVLVHQYLAPVGDTYWVQRQNTATAASGTTVTINDTAPTSDRYNLTICEVRPL